MLHIHLQNHSTLNSFNRDLSFISYLESVELCVLDRDTVVSHFSDLVLPYQLCFGLTELSST